MEIKQALINASNNLKQNNIENPIQKSKILLSSIMKVKKEYLIIHDKDELEENILNEYQKGILELISGKPLQYITNNQEFMKMNFYVDERVLIPRQDTEILVEEAIKECKLNAEKKYKILDLCTGSGAIGISLAKIIKKSEVLCVDISNDALEVAKKNAIQNEVKNIKFCKSDLFSNINEKFDIIVSNPPYIKEEVIKNLDKEVQNEPEIALNGGKDGLRYYKEIIKVAHKFLNKNGKIFLEIGYDQKNDVIELLKNNSVYKNIECIKDLYGNDRVIKTM